MGRFLTEVQEAQGCRGAGAGGTQAQGARVRMMLSP